METQSGTSDAAKWGESIPLPYGVRLTRVAFRGQGIGGALLQKLIDEAASTAKCVSIQVEQSNSAMRLYKRLGFIEVGDGGIYKQMEWRL